ncbi:MAG: dockerin type I repeat-containing protein, partial [Oscillospiraceae bacterium]
ESTTITTEPTYTTTTESTTITTEPTTTTETTATTPPNNETKKGDANGDGDVNTADALLILQYVINMNYIPNWQAAEVTNDWQITSEDALKILQYVVGIISEL